ncbi:unnamed protein product [Prunus armeniaca]|uniref:Uncharacterized protein n=1 Tax=Prunus armeniaca TaxID=36596 RepID=A0A6J5UP55_PRUAR|nr:unnamed protein product [Prunus armeniaca]
MLSNSSFRTQVTSGMQKWQRLANVAPKEIGSSFYDVALLLCNHHTSGEFPMWFFQGLSSDQLSHLKS